MAIHDAPYKVVVEYAGAGTRALAWLHEVAGSSHTVLEAGDRYAASSLAGLLGFKPQRFTVPQVAQLMANKAYLRARTLTKTEQVMGLGCTATITTNRDKKGEHRCYVSVRAQKNMRTYGLTLSKGARTREREEQLVSLLMLSALAQACGVTNMPDLPLLDEERVQMLGADELLFWVIEQRTNWVAVDATGIITAGAELPNIALLSGSFNPLHEGHRQLVQAAAAQLGQEVVFELPLHNADKATISVQEANRRAAQFYGGNVIFSRAPLFSQKAEIFPNSVFVIGADTAARLLQPRFHQHDAKQMHRSFALISQRGCRFLVAGRKSGGRFLTLEDVHIPADYRCLFEAIPEKRFRNDLSSTALRAKS